MLKLAARGKGRACSAPGSSAGAKQIVALGAAATAASRTARAQPATPVIGLLSSLGADVLKLRAFPGFLRGLGETGFAEGRNVAIEYRWAEGQYDRLPVLKPPSWWRGGSRSSWRRAAICLGVRATMAATSTIPIVFHIGEDPVALGLVPNLNRPGGNVTGASFFGGPALAMKQIELAHDLVPKAPHDRAADRPG